MFVYAAQKKAVSFLSSVWHISSILIMIGGVENKKWIHNRGGLQRGTEGPAGATQNKEINTDAPIDQPEVRMGRLVAQLARTSDLVWSVWDIWFCAGNKITHIMIHVVRTVTETHTHHVGCVEVLYCKWRRHKAISKIKVRVSEG